MAKVEVVVQEESEEPERRPFLEIARKVLMAGIGAVALAQEEIEEGLDTADAREAVRDQIEKISGFAGTGGVFTMSTTDHLGMAPGSLALIEIKDEEWTWLQ